MHVAIRQIHSPTFRRLTEKHSTHPAFGDGRVTHWSSEWDLAVRPLGPCIGGKQMDAAIAAEGQLDEIWMFLVSAGVNPMSEALTLTL